MRRPAFHVLVMAKAPVPGRAKTRLCPPCSPEEAAAVAEAALADTLETVTACHADRIVVALEGPPGPWLPEGLEVIEQRGGGLAERLAHAWADCATSSRNRGWGLQIGMDTPQVTAAELDGMLAGLRSANAARAGRPAAVLGGATDGGWWVIGLPGTDPYAVFDRLPMSSGRTRWATERRLRELGLDVMAAPVRTDIDRFDDLLAVAAEIPASRTAAVAGALAGHASKAAALQGASR